MNLSVIDSKIKRIEQLLKTVPLDDSAGLEIQSHWAKYTCVVISGALEESIKILLRQYAEQRASSPISNFASNQLGFFQTASTDEIGKLLAKFDKRWEKAFSDYLTEEIKTAVNSIVGNRHRVAHGLDSAVTISQLKEWFPKVDELLKRIALILLQ